MIHLRDASISYGARAVIEQLTLSVAAGSRVGLAGESGSGKSTILKALTGLLPSNTSTTGFGLPLPATGYIPQQPLASLSPYLTVLAQVAHLAPSLDHARSCLTRLGLDPRLHHSYPHQLSGGERQRVLIAQALAARPQIILADEPTAHLDDLTQKSIVSILDSYLTESGAALLIASHRPEIFTALRCQVHHLTPPQETNPPTPQPIAAAQPLLSVRDLSKTHRRRGFFLRSRPVHTALQSISLDIHPGETVALTGPSGSGKSTLARCLAARDPYDSGQILLRNQPLPSQPALAASIQLVQQEPSESLNPRLTLKDALAEATTTPPGGLIEAMQLPAAWLSRKCAELSEGQRARVAIARSLARLQSGLLILDESLAGLDLPTRDAILRHIQTEQTRSNIACLLITHDTALTRHCAHRTLTLQSGRLAA